jgi:hypothetical protein
MKSNDYHLLNNLNINCDIPLHKRDEASFKSIFTLREEI